MKREFSIIKNVTRVISEPGDMTRYDYIIIENYDNYMVVPFGSTFTFPQRLEYYSICNIETIEECIQFIKDNREHTFVNPNTLMEVINCIKEMRK